MEGAEIEKCECTLLRCVSDTGSEGDESWTAEVVPRESVAEVVVEKALWSDVAGCGVNCWYGEHNQRDNDKQKKSAG